MEGRKLCISEFQWFGVKPRDHSNDYYFCTCNVKDFNDKSKKGITHPDLPSAIQPIPHSPDFPVPIPPKNSSDLFDSDTASSSESPLQSDEFTCETSDAPELFTPRQLNDLVRDFNLPKDASELLGSRLKKKNLLAAGTS